MTGVYTGSDMNLNLTIQGMFANLLGEETVSHENLCWITKTHWPMESPLGAKKFSAEKCISVNRNPVDIFPSLCFLINLQSHSHTTNEKLNEADPVWWKAFTEMVASGLNKQTLEMNK